MLGAFLYIGGIVCMVLANAVAIIAGIYYWGGAGMELGPAAWEGAKIWLWMMGGGLITMIAGTIVE